MMKSNYLRAIKLSSKLNSSNKIRLNNNSSNLLKKMLMTPPPAKCTKKKVPFPEEDHQIITTCRSSTPRLSENAGVIYYT
jgi:hypothetical protein